MMDRSRDKLNWKSYDYSLLFVVAFLCVYGLIMIYSSSYYTAALKKGDGAYYLKRQLLFYLAGLAGAVILSLIPYRYFAIFTWPAYGISFLIMLLTDFTSRGIEVNGQKRWFKVTESISFQSAELVKISIILLAAYWIAKYLRKIDTAKPVVILAALCLPLVGLVIKNNLSSGFIILAIPVAMVMLVSRGKWRNIIFLALLVIGLAGILTIKFMSLESLMALGEKVNKAGLLEQYQLKRIYIWNDPLYDAQDSGYQVVQGLYAIGSGGVFGKGLGGSTQKLGFVPEASNDMIFAILCEELGLFGAVALVILYVFLLYRMLMIVQRTRDMYGAMLVVGVMAHLALQVVLHIAVVCNVIPNTGVTLPFISYGGTSSLFTMAEIGIVLSVAREEETAPAEQKERSV